MVARGAKKSRFTQADVQRAFKGAKDAGLNVRVTIDTMGCITITPILDVAGINEVIKALRAAAWEEEPNPFDL